MLCKLMLYGREKEELVVLGVGPGSHPSPTVCRIHRGICSPCQKGRPSTMVKKEAHTAAGRNQAYSLDVPLPLSDITKLDGIVVHS